MKRHLADEMAAGRSEVRVGQAELHFIIAVGSFATESLRTRGLG